MKALFLDKQDSLSLRDAALPQELGANDVRIKIANVGICGSDVHYYLHGKIGGFVVNEPMVLGHEASGTITEIGSAVKNLKVGDRVCMEPGIPDYASSQTLQGMYNLDPDVRFWATPPIHGCLRESIVHPANLTFKLPDNVSLAEGAMVEPLAVGMQAATKARIAPGAAAVVAIDDRERVLLIQQYRRRLDLVGGEHTSGHRRGLRIDIRASQRQQQVSQLIAVDFFVVFQHIRQEQVHAQAMRQVGNRAQRVAQRMHKANHGIGEGNAGHRRSLRQF